MRLENWSILWSKGEDYLAPELRHKQAQGMVYGHDHFKDGTHIVTSALMEINLDEKYIKTMNSCYELGEPDPEYIKSLQKFVVKEIKMTFPNGEEVFITPFNLDEEFPKLQDFKPTGGYGLQKPKGEKE